MPTMQSQAEEVAYYPRSLREKYLLDQGTPIQLLVGGWTDAPTADIGREPDQINFGKISWERAHLREREQGLPEGWPQILSGPLVWDGEQFKPDEWVHWLSAGEVGEIEAALARFKGLKLDLGDMRKVHFPLPSLSVALGELSSCLHEGRGFFTIRGLEPKKYSREDNVMIYLGISSYIGERRGRQTQQGTMMYHVTDASISDVPKSHRRAIYNNVGQPYHTDVLCDILAMYCLSPAAKGGDVHLAPIWTVYNELASSRPDIINELARNDWVHDTSGRHPPYHLRALLHYFNKNVVLNFSSRVLKGDTVSRYSHQLKHVVNKE